MKLLGSTERRISKYKNGDNLPQLEINEVVLVHYNVINNYYQLNLWFLFTFEPSKSFYQLLNVLPENHIFLEIFHLDFLYIEVWFTYRNSRDTRDTSRDTRWN